MSVRVSVILETQSGQESEVLNVFELDVIPRVGESIVLPGQDTATGREYFVRRVRHIAATKQVHLLVTS